MVAGRSQFGEYLRARRAVIKPEQVGLVPSSARRVEGLRREEVARLADISGDYYLRLEQGRARRPSDQVLDALARALALDVDAASYLRRLARGDEAPPASAVIEPDPTAVSFADLVTDAGVLLVDLNFDVLHANPLGRWLLPGVADRSKNLVVELFTRARERIMDWEEVAADLLATMRFVSSPEDPRLHEVIGVLTVKSSDFANMWARHDVRCARPLRVTVLVSDLGRVALDCQMLFVAEERQALITIAGANTARDRASMTYLQTMAAQL